MQRLASSCAPSLAAALLISVAGCAGGPDQPAVPAVQAPAGGPATAALVNLRPVTLTDFRQTLADLRGKVVVVDYWQDT